MAGSAYHRVRMFRVKVKITPGEEQVCDYYQFCSGKNYYFLVQEKAWKPPCLHGDIRLAMPTEVGMGSLEKSQCVEHLASATHDYGNTPVLARLLKPTPFGSTFGCYRVQVFVTLGCDARLHYEEYAALKRCSELSKINFGKSYTRKNTYFVFWSCDGSSSIIHLP